MQQSKAGCVWICFSWVRIETSSGVLVFEGGQQSMHFDFLGV
jgi:hypothetical protein